MNTKDFIRLGVPLGEATRRATDFVSKFILSGGDKTRLEDEVKAIIADPSAFKEDSLRQEFAKALLAAPPPPRTEPVKYRQWGQGLEHEAVMQMEKACLLPVAVAGALMPDAHVGYGLPIGGVLATENTVIPYAVGVDIACRMKMTVLVGKKSICMDHKFLSCTHHDFGDKLIVQHVGLVVRHQPVAGPEADRFRRHIACRLRIYEEFLCPGAGKKTDQHPRQSDAQHHVTHV